MKRITFVVTILLIAEVTAAAQSVKVTEKPISSLLLANGAENQFEAFVLVTNKHLSNTQEWGNFSKVVRLYNTNSKALMSADKATQANFNDALAFLNRHLPAKNAQNWLHKANYTARAINFMWNLPEVNVSPIVEEVAINVQ